MKKRFTKVGTWILTSSLALLGFSGCSNSKSNDPTNPGRAECIYGGPNMMDLRNLDEGGNEITTAVPENPDSVSDTDINSGATSVHQKDDVVPVPIEETDSTITEGDEDIDTMLADPAAYREQLLREHREQRYGRDVCLYGATNVMRRRNV